MPDFSSFASWNSVTRHLKHTLWLIWLGLFLGNIFAYEGSWHVYVIFTVVLTTVLLSGIYQKLSYGYLFFAIFFWLGFWFKLSMHNLFYSGYVEPIGRFDGSVAAWDEALWVPTVAGLGMLLARWLYGRLRREDGLQFSPGSAKVPAWYPAHRQIIWIALLGAVVILAALNSFYGIQQSGLTPRTILIWPLNGLIYWMLSTGLSMALATILWWDICLKRDISWSIYALFAEAFVSTMSLLSRGLFVFHLVPPLLAIGLNRQKLVWRAQKRFFRVVVLLLIFFFFAISIVSTARNYLYQQGEDFRTTTQIRISNLKTIDKKIVALEEAITTNYAAIKPPPGNKRLGLGKDVPLADQLEEFRGKRATTAKIIEEERVRVSGELNTPTGNFKLLLSEFLYQITGGVLDKVSTLAVHRWIGMEGAMAVSSYPEKSMNTFATALAETSESGHVSLYQGISQSLYQNIDPTKYRFASIPGVAAFFYFSGSLWLVFFGLFGLILVMLLAERLTRALTGNTLLCALLGMNAANALAQLGIVPRQLLIHFGMIAVAIVCVSLVQLGNKRNTP